MTSFYWLKLWLDMLNDRMFVQMDDRMWRKYVEFQMIAKEYDKDGDLPDVDTIAFRLRSDVAWVAEAMDGLTKLGLLSVNDEGFTVVDFLKRQDRQSSSERGKLYRSRQASFAETDDEHSANDNRTDSERIANETQTDREREADKSQDRIRQIEEFTEKLNLSIPKRKDFQSWVNNIAFPNGSVVIEVKSQSEMADSRWSGIDPVEFIQDRYGKSIRELMPDRKVIIKESE